MKAIGPAFCLVLAVAPGVSAQTDRMVPSANYPTLQAAVNASVAGDRIVLADGHSESGPILINKPLTIEAVVGGTATFFLYTPNYSCPFGGSGNACFGINTTDPSVPLILRRVAFSLAEMGGDTYGLVANVAGEARFENVSFNHGGGYHGSSGPTLRLTASTVWMKNVTFTAANRVWDYACWDSDRGGGVSCLDVQAGKLVMEGCSLSAGSAAQYMSHPDGCYSCYQAPYVHFPRGGGNAIYANTQLTVLTRCSFSDGNGSGATNPNAPGICPTSAPAGAPGTSSFTGPSGTLIAHASQHERGIAGGAGGFRGGFFPIGSPLAPLTTDGNASPGGTLAIQIGQVPNNLALLLLTVGWDANPTPIGTLPVSIAATLWSTAVTTPWSTNIAVPNLPSLRYLPIASQVYWFDPDIQIGNASGTWIDRR